MTDSWLFRAEVSLIVGALVAIVLWRLMLALDGRGFTASYRLPIAAGLALRLLAVLVALLVPEIGHKLTSTDEAGFLATAKTLAALPLSSSKWLSMALHWTEVIPWALTYKLFGNCGTLPLRLEQIGLSLGAVVGVSAAAGRIGGRRAGLITAWIAALEPSSAYFGGLLHQEALCMVGEALLVAALVEVWMRDGPRWQTLLAAVAGLALIFGTRSYMALFAGVAALLTVAAAALCRRMEVSRGMAVLVLLAVVLGFAGIVAAPHVVPGTLAKLQQQLDAPYPGANLRLPHVTVTSAGGLLKTVVWRSLDLLLRPFPWQTHSAAQQVAVVGTLVWYALVLLALLLTIRQGLDGRLAPVLILVACETVGFALTLLDAGEGFRHRVNLVLLLAIPLGVMLDRNRSPGVGALADRDRNAGIGALVEGGGHMRHLGSAYMRGSTYAHMYISEGAARRGPMVGRRLVHGRMVLPGALCGLIVALAFTLAMPARQIHSIDIPAPHGQPVIVYGPFQPYAPPALSQATVQRSPRILRDALLGLLAGGLAAGALTTVGRERRLWRG